MRQAWSFFDGPVFLFDDLFDGLCDLVRVLLALRLCSLRPIERYEGQRGAAV